MSKIGSTPILAFDIETLPDPRAIRAQGLSDKEDDDEAIQEARDQRMADTGSDFLPVPCQRVLVVSCVLRTREKLQVISLEDTDGFSEAKAVQDFFDLIGEYVPQLVSWNGKGFDLPVLNLRSMVHGIVAPTFWEQGERERDFKWSNYINRYHTRHLDVMDVLSMHNGRASSKLDVMARLCGFPGKVGGVDGSQVYDTWKAGRADIVRKYCETDVMNTYLLYLRFLQVSGQINAEEFAEETQVVVDTLDALYKGDSQEYAHWDQFLTAWVAPPPQEGWPEAAPDAAPAGAAGPDQAASPTGS